MVFIYNIYFHPLARFPGPKWAAATKIPIARVSWKGEQPKWVKSLHEQYRSDVVRVSPDELSFIGADAWNDIYSYRRNHPNAPKDPTLHAGIEGMLIANDSDHARLRRVFAHAFSDKALREQESLIQAYVDALMAQIRQYAGKKVDMVERLHWLSFDIISDLSFGEPFDCLKNSKFHPWVTRIMDAISSVIFVSTTRRFPPLDRLLAFLTPPSLIRASVEHKRAIRERVDRRIKMETNRADFMSYILRHNDEKGLSRHEIDVNMGDLIVAGSETSANMLSSAIYLILTHPAVHKKLEAEIRTSFKEKEYITIQSTLELPYLQAVIDESFRVHSPSQFGQPRRLLPQGETICGHFVPGGTGVTVFQNAMFRSATHFKDPDAFAPERWLGDERYEDDHRGVVNPFSVGNRNCIGKK